MGPPPLPSDPQSREDRQLLSPFESTGSRWTLILWQLYTGDMINPKCLSFLAASWLPMHHLLSHHFSRWLYYLSRPPLCWHLPAQCLVSIIRVIHEHQSHPMSNNYNLKIIGNSRALTSHWRATTTSTATSFQFCEAEVDHSQVSLSLIFLHPATVMEFHCPIVRSWPFLQGSRQEEPSSSRRGLWVM